VRATSPLRIVLGATPVEERLMNWAILLVAGLFEIGWAIGLKYTEGFSRLWPTVLTILSMVLSVGLLGVAMNTLPVGTAYAVWVGVGAIGTALLGIIMFNEPANAARLASLALILAGIIGLKLSMP
jgi:quaternary ammonium compound-resistance protein SugE